MFCFGSEKNIRVNYFVPKTFIFKLSLFCSSIIGKISLTQRTLSEIQAQIDFSLHLLRYMLEDEMKRDEKVIVFEFN